jgi:hypothetical protein
MLNALLISAWLRLAAVPAWDLALPAAGGWVVVEGAVDEIGAAEACPAAIE